MASYLVWGVLPIYWKWLDGIATVEILAHRVVWTLVVVVLFQVGRHRLAQLRATWADPASRRAHFYGAVLLNANWGVYVWAVAADRIIEASLGYFLVPLLNAVLGRLWWGERLRRMQLVALLLAAAGVGVMVWRVDTVPWVALALACTWTAYGFSRKRSHASAVDGLALETTFSLPFALGFLLWLAWQGEATFGHAGAGTHLLLVGTGVVSMLPLVLFAYGARRLRFTTLGLLQYVAPTCQFLIGWLVYREPFSAGQAAAFALIWAGLACYTVDALRAPARVPPI